MYLRLIALLSASFAAFAQQAKSISEVHVIFVGPLGPDENATLVRDKMINRLANSQRFQVTLEEAKADAVLTGSAQIAQGVRFGSDGSGGTRYDGTAVIRLIAPDKTILWTYETKNSMFARSASSSVADHIVKELVKTATPKVAK